MAAVVSGCRKICALTTKSLFLTASLNVAIRPLSQGKQPGDDTADWYYNRRLQQTPPPDRDHFHTQ
jgi:hypothetical protein